MWIEQWFKAFAARHIDRHPRGDWPRLSENPEFYAGWQSNFALPGLTEEVADEASRRLMAAPPKFLADHIPALITAAKAILRERGLGHDPDSREAAELASESCDDCTGQGLTFRWRKGSAGSGPTRDPVIVLYCRCPLGRFFEQAHRTQNRDIRLRIYDLEKHPFLWGHQYRQKPADAPAFSANHRDAAPES